MIKRFLYSIALASLTLAVTMPALAQDAASTPAPTPTPVVRPAADLACMQMAVEKRDNAIIAAVDDYHTNLRSALETRRDALKTAWGLADRKTRRQAIWTAWIAFKKSRLAAKKTFQLAKKTAWNQFNTDRKICGAGVRADDNTPPGIDAAS